MSIMRRGIAEHMRRSLDTAAHVTSAIEVDMSKVAAIRERIKAEFASSYGVNPTYLAFIARATVDTLRDWPWVNAELRGDAILTRSYVNLGFAVAARGRQGPDRAGAASTPRGSTCSGWPAASPTWPSGRGRASSFPTTSRAAPSRSRTRAASARCSERRSSASRSRRSSAPTRSSSGPG